MCWPSTSIRSVRIAHIDIHIDVLTIPIIVPGINHDGMGAIGKPRRRERPGAGSVGRRGTKRNRTLLDRDRRVRICRALEL